LAHSERQTRAAIADVLAVHPGDVRIRALELVEQGLNDCEVSRRLGIPRSTIRDWRRPWYRPKTPPANCPRCFGAAKPMMFTAPDYAELLGLYLGDGFISQGARTARLRIYLDAKYPGIVDATKALLERCFPRNRVDIVDHGTMSCVSVYSSHLKCLIPQHGAGKKHERRISLEPWQRRLLEEAPWGFLRGCIRSDGCVFVNRTAPYEYLSFDFCNKSEDIIALFTTSCDLVGVKFRVNCWNGSWRVRINRRGSVSQMLANVGLKT
jgi:Homeodomain-like domain